MGKGALTGFLVMAGVLSAIALAHSSKYTLQDALNLFDKVNFIASRWGGLISLLTAIVVISVSLLRLRGR